MKKKMLFLTLAFALLVPNVKADEVSNTSELKNCFNSGGTCTITDNIDASSEGRIEISKDVILDLNEKTLQALLKVTDKTLTINSSVTGGKLIVDTTNDSRTSGIAVDGGTLIVESGTITNPVATAIGCFDGGKVTINGGEITAKNSALGGNNTKGTMYFEVNGGTLTAERGPAIYMPHQVSLKMTNGTLNGGISLRMGTVDISGGVINAATGTYGKELDDPKDYYSYSGNAWLPDALYVFGGTYTSDSGYDNALKLTITGGEFNVTNGVGSAVAIYDLGKLEQKMNINITGGTFTTNSTDRNAYDVLSLNDIGVTSPEAGYDKYVGKVETSITGGTFSTDVSEYLGEYYVANKVSAGYKIVENKTLTTSDEKVTFESEEALNSSYSLVIVKSDTKEAVEKVKDKYSKNTKIKDLELIDLYDISIMNDKEIVPMKDGKFTIYISIDEEKQGFDNYQVVYIDEAGEIKETIDAKLVNGKIVFTTTHLSTYGIVGYNNVEATNPQTGDINLFLVLTTLTMTLVISSLVIRKKIINNNI